MALLMSKEMQAVDKVTKMYHDMYNVHVHAHASKDLQPTAPVLKAGHLLCCCLFVHFIGWGFLGFLSPPFFLFAIHIYTVYIYMYV